MCTWSLLTVARKVMRMQVRMKVKRRQGEERDISRRLPGITRYAET
jgi:hypothetical protein